MRVPRSKRRFRTNWEEIQYLCGKMHFWIHCRKSARSRAERFAGRLADRVSEVDPNSEAILLHEAKALLAEFLGDLETAIKFRSREIAAMKRLYASLDENNSSKETREWALQNRGEDVLKVRLAILKRHKSKLPGR